MKKILFIISLFICTASFSQVFITSSGGVQPSGSYAGYYAMFMQGGTKIVYDTTARNAIPAYYRDTTTLLVLTTIDSSFWVLHGGTANSNFVKYKFGPTITYAAIVAGLGYTPANAATTLTINGIGYDLSANRSWTISLSSLGGEPSITAGTTSQYWRGDKTWQTLNASAVGLGNVSNVAQVTSVGAGTGLSSSGGTTPSISIASGYYLPSTSDQSAWNAKQSALSGTGFVKISGTSISYDNSTYLTTSSASSTYVPQAGGVTMTGLFTLSGDPSTAYQPATKNYVDNLVTGLYWKASAHAATTANITLSGTQTIDGVAVGVGDRVLVKNQSTGSQNGIYVVASGAWSRSTDANTGTELWGATIFIDNGGTVNGGTQWSNSNTTSPTLGTDAITFAQIAGAGVYTNGTYLSLTGNVFDVGSTYSSNWNTAYNRSGTGLTFTSSTFTFTEQSGATLTASVPTFNQNTTGSAATLTTARTINGVSFDGSANITITAAAGTLTGTTLNSTVVSSSLTSVGTLGTGTWQATIISPTYGGTGVNNGSATLTMGGSHTLSGAYASTFTFTGITSVTFPTSGTLATQSYVTGQGYLTGNQSISLTGDITGSGATSIATTLATVNSNTGSFGGTSVVPIITVNGKGLITAVSTGTITPASIGAQASFTSQTANYFFAAPNGSSGTPSFRAIVAADIPTLNQNTTGNAGTVSNGVYTTGSYSDPSWLSISKSKVGLSLVENTALSTWVGSANLTTVGTLSSGSIPYSLLTGTVPTWNQNTTGTAANITAYTINQSVGTGNSPTFAGGTYNGIVTINTSVRGLILNRPSTSNYTGTGLQTNGTQYWMVGMRENLTSNNYIVYNETTGHDAITISTSNDAVTLAGYLTVPGGAGTSDIRLKTNIVYNPSISILDSIDFIQYNMKDNLSRLRYGNIAQQVEKFYPDLVLTNDKGIKAIMYDDLQNIEIHELNEKIKLLETKMIEFEKRIK